MLTSECVNCPFWRDSETESGCAFPRPIDECKAFAEAYNEVDDDEDEAFEKYMDAVKSDVAWCLGIEEYSDEWYELMDI